MGNHYRITKYHKDGSMEENYSDSFSEALNRSRDAIKEEGIVIASLMKRMADGSYVFVADIMTADPDEFPYRVDTFISGDHQIRLFKTDGEAFHFAHVQAQKGKTSFLLKHFMGSKYCVVSEITKEGYMKV